MMNVEKAPKSKIEQKKEMEVSPEYVQVAERALKGYLQLKSEEKVLLIKDRDTDGKTAVILEKAIDAIGSSRKEFMLSKKSKKEEILQLLQKYETIISISAGDYGTSDDIYDDIKETKNRFLALLDIDKEAFKPGGALEENPAELVERLNRMEALLSRARGFKITSVYGTDLNIPIRPLGERRWIKETGVLNPGEWGNLPVGEIYTTPDETRTNGTLMLPVLESTIKTHQGVDEFVKLTIKDGVIVAIDGGKSAEVLRDQLAKESKESEKEYNDPWAPYRIAEMGFGANSKARGVVADPDKSYRRAGVSVVEAEKRFGTIHLAFGDAKHGDEGAEGFHTASSHYDFVIPRNGLTVEMFTSEQDFDKKNKGQKIINDGGINFF
ncbi:MAG: hypothetical protein UV48_C0006G0011 [Candidatus Azambacteria bacterium GW2011_GWA2_42_9]|uniref:Leucyl aminopeptidase n=2 Tax=Candidatus Azamiibacteriota TaxID=1752741 RepID=A0A0G1BR22_9BACT|nr:MAG: hypothetical protein UV48_C0006G0011 [Candidatus Azambacteria bacterium GW2011_GWA2_42_9]KKS88909.1 MAG: hypothetical protein UV62_C0001G0051 [Parcubacteria group bacterium GW2011_GWC1_43_11]